jgi:hypothetical protein
MLSLGRVFAKAAPRFGTPSNIGAPLSEQIMVGGETDAQKRKRRNKSAIIRQFLETNPHLGPTEVVAALKQRRIKVTRTLVSNVKSRMAAGSAREGQKNVRVGRGVGKTVSVSDLVSARKFANHMGSIAAAIRALETLRELSG